MTIEELKETDWIIFEGIRGSHAYGLNTPTSDIDKAGIFIMPTEEVLKANPTSDGNYTYIPQISDEKNDVVYYEIGRFIELLEKGNPNILELLNLPKECVLYKNNLFDKYFPNPSIYLTKNLKNTFIGYSKSQIGKAKGMNKKIHNPQPKIRKEILDFCYLIDGSQTKRMLDYYPKSRWDYSKCGVVKLPHGKGLYAVYFDNDGLFNFRGLLKKKGKGVSNEVRLSSIPKTVYSSVPCVSFYFDLDGYKQHCKQHREYWEWVEKRNPERYKENMKGNVGYDYKNISHCVRLIETAIDIVKYNKIQVKRPNRLFLLSIRNGEHTYEDIMEYIDEKLNNLEGLFEKSSLPDNIDKTYTRNLLKTIRIENFKKELLT